MKNILVIFIFWMGCMLAVQAQQHPCVYVSPSDKVTVRQKVKNEPWAGEAFAAIRSKVENMWIVIRPIPSGSFPVWPCIGKRESVIPNVI